MPSPNKSLATLRPDLGASLEEFDLEADRGGFVGQKVFPVMDVATKSDTYGVIPVEEMLRDSDLRRVPKSGYNRDDFEFTDRDFSCKEYGKEQIIDDAESNIYANYFDLELIATRRAMDKVMRGAEKRVADKVFNSTTYTNQTTAVVNEWDDADNADPITDIEAAVQAVFEQCGMWPNALVINKKVFRNLRNCASILERIKYQGFTDVKASQINPMVLASLFDLDQVLVAGGTRNSAQKGQSAIFSQIWSDEYAWVGVVATDNDIQQPCVGRTFHYVGDGSQVDGRVEIYREEGVRGDVVRVRHQTDENDVYSECGHLLSNITT
ncbi:MAG: hypothetical protein AAGF31_12945 [Planctomycetota bacterium]